jgi:hypothetical protein
MDTESYQMQVRKVSDHLRRRLTVKALTEN